MGAILLHTNISELHGLVLEHGVDSPPDAKPFAATGLDPIRWWRTTRVAGYLLGEESDTSGRVIVRQVEEALSESAALDPESLEAFESTRFQGVIADAWWLSAGHDHLSVGWRGLLNVTSTSARPSARIHTARSIMRLGKATTPITFNRRTVDSEIFVPRTAELDDLGYREQTTLDVVLSSLRQSMRH